MNMRGYPIGEYSCVMNHLRGFDVNAILSTPPTSSLSFKGSLRSSTTSSSFIFSPFMNHETFAGPVWLMWNGMRLGVHVGKLVAMQGIIIRGAAISFAFEFQVGRAQELFSSLAPCRETPGTTHKSLNNRIQRCRRPCPLHPSSL
jgi:hypothetical protein